MTCGGFSLVTLAADVGAAFPIYRDLMAVLVCAGIVTLVLGKLRLATIPGYIIAGTIIGPYALGLVTSPDNIDTIAQLSIVLLMFTIGLHMDVSGSKKGMISTVAVGVISTLATLVVVAGPAMAFGASLPAAIGIGMALSLSSTAVILKVLQDRRELHRSHGRLAFGTLLIQDMIVIGYLALLPTLAALAPAADAAGATDMDEPDKWLGILASSAVTIGVVAGMIVFGRYALPKLVQYAARGSNPEILLVLGAAIAMGAAVVTNLIGLGMPLGAFIAGFLLAGTPVRYQLSGQLHPLRDLFAAVFFTSVGLILNLGEVAESWLYVLAGIGLLLALKGAVIALTSWSFGATASVAFVAALTLAGAGEFSLVFLVQASREELFTDAQEAVLIAIVVASLIVTPSLMSLGTVLRDRLGHLPTAPWVRRSTLSDDADETKELRDHVVLAGFGPVGRAVAARFELANVPFVIIELNPNTIRRQRALGRKVVYGDAMNPEVLVSVGADKASAVILTIPDDDATLRSIRAVREIAPHVFIAARTTYMGKGLQARELGANDVTVEEVATAEVMAEQVLSSFGRHLEQLKSEQAKEEEAQAQA